MTTITETPTMSGKEIVDLSRKHTLYEWSAQSKVDPIPVARAKGIYFYTPEGKRFIDFNSQLMSVNIGHGDERVIQAISEQAATLAYANPFMATEPRARLGAKLAEITPGDIDTFFFTNGGAEANENAIKLARFFTGRHKIIARYRSYHGATAGAISLTGDPRRWAAEPGIPGVVHVLDPYHGIERGWESAESSLAMIEETIQLEGPQTIAAFILEPVTGTNGVLVPPDGYLEGRAQALRQVRHRDDRRRSDVRLRTHRRMVRRRSLEGCPRSALHGQGINFELSSARRGRHAASHRAALSGQSVLRRPHLQQPSHGLRGGAGHHSRV